MNEEITVTKLRSNEGSILVFEGVDEDGNTVTFGADHRPGRDIAEMLESGDTPVCDVPTWAILARTSVENQTNGIDHEGGIS